MKNKNVKQLEKDLKYAMDALRALVPEGARTDEARYEDQADEITRITGWEFLNTGGNIYCFFFDGIGANKGKNQLLVGYSSETPGYCVEDADGGYDGGAQGYMRSRDYSAKSQIRFIKRVCKRLGFDASYKKQK